MRWFMSHTKIRTSTQPFATGDVVRYYHHTSMFDDALVVHARSNGALEVIRKGIRYYWSARTVVMSPNQDQSIGIRYTRFQKLCTWLKNLL